MSLPRSGGAFFRRPERRELLTNGCRSEGRHAVGRRLLQLLNGPSGFGK